MMTAPSIVARYAELHGEALRSEAQRDRLAAPCQPNVSLLQRVTRRAWRAAAPLKAVAELRERRVEEMQGEWLPSR
jgi:hypothetical protein